MCSPLVFASNRLPTVSIVSSPMEPKAADDPRKKNKTAEKMPQSLSRKADQSPSASGRKTERVSQNVALGLHRYGYFLGRTLGTGAYAKVKSAHAIRMNRQVAVKIINRKGAPKDFLGKFLPREIESLRAVNHENVIHLHEVIVTDQQVYLIVEMAENGDLLDYINARGYLHEGVAQRFFIDFTNAMITCHGAGIVHRDLKCENLLLDRNYRIKVSDFGFATKFSGQDLETYCGSYAYAAPEVILGTPYDGEKSDIWSMGVILYAMVVGRLPFKDSDVKTLLADIGNNVAFPLWVSEECKSLIRSTLTFSQYDRAPLLCIQQHPWMTKVFESLPDPSLKPKPKKTPVPGPAKAVPVNNKTPAVPANNKTPAAALESPGTKANKEKET